jgi:Zn-dependent peptidase ImmA (M78 family)
MEDLGQEEILAAVDAAVEELLHGAGTLAPPVDAIALAQGHLGMAVCLDRRQPQRGRAQRVAGARQIFLRPEPTEERHQWTVAHEIGEHLKVDMLRRLHVDPADLRAMAGESLANLFAYHLLVPTCWFRADAPAQGCDVLELKKRYRTASHEVIAWRFLDLSAPCIITIIDNDRIRRRRSNAWRTKKQLHPIEDQCRAYINQHGVPHALRAQGWTVHGWPVHTREWKREILRSEVEEDVL